MLLAATAGSPVPEWLADLVTGVPAKRSVLVEGNVEEVMRVLDEFSAAFGWHRIVVARSASAVLVLRRRGEILRFTAASAPEGPRPATRVTVEGTRARP